MALARAAVAEQVDGVRDWYDAVIIRSQVLCGNFSQTNQS